MSSFLIKCNNNCVFFECLQLHYISPPSNIFQFFRNRYDVVEPSLCTKWTVVTGVASEWVKPRVGESFSTRMFVINVRRNDNTVPVRKSVLSVKVHFV
jgi:hypothetical protein